MAKILVDVELKSGEDSTAFSDSFSSNTNVELKNPMVSIPSLVVMRVEESYFDTFKSDSRIKTAERPDQAVMCSPATIPAVTTMSGKKIVVSSTAWDTSNPGSDYIGAQFYYDSDSIPPNPLAEQTQTVYLTAYGSGNYSAEFANDVLSITHGQSNPTINILEGTTLQLNPPGTGYVGEITAAGGGAYSIKDWSRSANNWFSTGTAQSNPTFNLEVGDTLDFYNTGVYTGHPIYFKTAATTGTGDLVASGAYGQGADGSGLYSASAGIDTTGWTPGTYYYQCGNHAGMGGQIIVHASGSYYNHPLYLKTAQGVGTGNQLTNGGGISGVSGQGSNTGATDVMATFGAGSAGTYYYQCGLHSGMNGQIVVTAGDNNTVGTRTWSAGANPDTGNSYSNVKYESRWTGKNVDIVTMEVGGNYLAANHHENHPDFDSLTSPGTSRFIPQDWPGLSDTANNQVSNGTERLTGHGCGVLSAAGGTICGFAKHSNLYQMSSDGPDSFAEMYDSLLTWHNAKSVNGATGKKNPTIAIGEVQWATWWDRAIPIDEIQAITWDGTDVVTRPASGWGNDLTPFVDRSLIPRQLKDPDTSNWVWVIGMPYTGQYSALNTAMDACLTAGIHCISAASNQGQIFVKNADPKYSSEELRVNSGATFYTLGVQNNPWELTISKGTTTTTSHSPWYNYGTHGHTDGIDVAAGQNSEQWSVLDSYSCRGPGVDVVGMGANTFTSYPSTTFADGAAIKWGMFSGTSCATPTVVGKAACLLEKYFTYNNDYPTSAQLKTIVCQKQYSYGHNSNDTYRKRHIMKSDSTLRSIAGQTGGGIDWSNVPAASGTSFSTHAYGSRGLCQLEAGDYVNGSIVLLENAGTPRQKPFLGTTDDRNRLQQLQGVRQLSGATYPRPKITRTDTYPSLK